MRILVSNSSDKPLYEQIKNQIKEAIFGGELSAGDPLPSIRTLANELHVSVLTIRRVYDDLETEGFTSSKVGRGTFVIGSNMEALKEAKRVIIEKKLFDIAQEAKKYGIDYQEMSQMLLIIFREDI